MFRNNSLRPTPRESQPEQPGYDSKFHNEWEMLEPELRDDAQSYIFHYDFGTIGHSLLELEKAQLRKNRKDWAKTWALALSNGEPRARELNYHRKICLKFLYRIIDNNLVTAFKSYRIDRIVRTCVVMDRVNALYNMINFVTNSRGLHWFSELDRAWMESLLKNPAEIQLLRQARATLDRRLRGLLENENLCYGDDVEVREWMIPCKAGTQ